MQKLMPSLVKINYSLPILNTIYFNGQFIQVNPSTLESMLQINTQTDYNYIISFKEFKDLAKIFKDDDNKIFTNAKTPQTLKNDDLPNYGNLTNREADFLPIFDLYTPDAIQEFKDAMQASFPTCTSDLRPTLHNVFYRKDLNAFLATDIYRLSIFKSDTTLTNILQKDFWIPFEVRNFINGLKGYDDIISIKLYEVYKKTDLQVHTIQNWKFGLGDDIEWDFYIQKSFGTYPDVTKILYGDVTKILYGDLNKLYSQEFDIKQKQSDLKLAEKNDEVHALYKVENTNDFINASYVLDLMQNTKQSTYTLYNDNYHALKPLVFESKDKRLQYYVMTIKQP